MTSISPHKTGCCHVCRTEGDRTNKPLTWNLCDKHYKEKELVKKSRYNEKAIEKKKSKEIKPIAIRSQKRAKEEREYNKQAKSFKLANPDCAARLKGCTGGTTDVHHMKGRDGDLLLDQHYWLPVCNHCHRWIELNPVKAKILGLSVSRLEVTAA